MSALSNLIIGGLLSDCAKMIVCRHGALLSNPYAKHALPFLFSNGKIWEVAQYTTFSAVRLSMRISSTCTSCFYGPSISKNHVSRNLGRKQERKVGRVVLEHHNLCNFGKSPYFRSFCMMSESSSFNGQSQSVIISAKQKSLSTSSTRTECSSPKLHLMETSGAYSTRQLRSQSYEELSMIGCMVGSYCKCGRTFRSFLNPKELLDYSSFQTRDLHFASSSWHPCACILRTRAYPYTDAWSNHLQFERASNGQAAIRSKSTTTTRDKLRARIRSQLPELKGEDLEEQFVRGSGPGGQATNKTSNCVVLRHIPTGIVVKCHQTRSQSENQKIARLLMKEKLDQYLHGDKSAIAQHQQAMHKKREEKKRKTRLKLEKLKALRSSVDDLEESGGNSNEDLKDKDK